MELIVVIWILALASARVLQRMAVDSWAQIHGREAPSLIERRERVELAQRQFETTGTPGVGQAIADRLAERIANPPPRPAWITEALAYFGLLLADAFAASRRRHVEKERERHGKQPRSGKSGGPYCWSCEINHVDRDGELCDDCTPVVLARCRSCHVHVPVGELRNKKCATCRQPARPAAAPPEPSDPNAPVQLVIPG